MSVIGLSAEVRVCTVLTRETGGSYHVILDESHFKELLMLHVKPPPASSSSECSLIRMGEQEKDQTTVEFKEKFQSLGCESSAPALTQSLVVCVCAQGFLSTPQPLSQTRMPNRPSAWRE